jgi:hypothetical protein
MDYPKIVCIIGSTRFKDFHLGAAQRETLKGKIVIGAGFFHHRDQVPITAEAKEKLDILSMAKINLADEVLVININGYVGETTKMLILFALGVNKPITYLEPVV